MPTFALETRDQALLAMVVEESQKVISEIGQGYLGRTALQKILYFLKVLGVPMEYRFDIHHHGPFCVDILNDANMLKLDGILEDKSRSTEKYSDYRTTERAETLIARHAGDLDDYRQKVKEVVQTMVPLEPKRLELLATLDYAYRWVKATGLRSSIKDETIKRFFEIKKDKKDKFPERDVEKAYDDFVQAGIFG